jgi:flavin reductase (DIM6/NTAB) family NADH-FMN oxidoreductase RutF
LYDPEYGGFEENQNYSMILNMPDLTAAEKQSWLLSAVAPRPIALASTISRDGQVNLSPFSFFNVFSSEPPILIFSPARRLRDASRKHTLMNIEELGEVAISVVDAAILDRVNTASAEYPDGVNEFECAGFTQMKSTRIRPPFVAESKISMECKVTEVKPMGRMGGAGNLIICEVLVMHINENILDTNQKICPVKLNQVGRLGGDWYCSIDEFVLFTLPKPNGLPEKSNS